MSFISHEQDQLLWFTSSLLKNVRHGFSTRKGGVSQGHLASLNLRGAVPSGDDPELVLENYRRFCAAIGTDVNAAVLSKQVHETTVRICTEADAGKGLWSERDYTADALITNVKDLPLTVFSADCGISCCTIRCIRPLALFTLDGGAVPPALWKKPYKP